MKKVKELFAGEFGKDILITAIGQIAVLLLSFIVNKLVSIYLGPTLYTDYSITIKSATVIAYVAVFGLGIALPKFFPQKDDKGVARSYLASITLMFTVTITIFLLMFIFKEVAAKIIYGDISYVYFILPLTLYAIYIAFVTFLYAYYRALKRFYFFNVMQILVQAVILIFVFISRDNLILFIYLVGIVIAFVSLVLILFYTKKHYKAADIRNFGDLKPEVKELFGFCLPRVPGDLFLFALGTVPLIILKQKIGDYNTTGFAISIMINTMVTSLFSFIGMVLLPYVSKSIHVGDYNEVDDKIKRLGLVYSVIAIVGVIGIYLFTTLIIRILYSSEYLVYQDTVKIIALSILPNAAYLLIRNPIDAISNFPFNTINLGITFASLTAMLLLFDNITAYAYSFVISYLILGVLSLLSWIFARRRSRKNGDNNQYEKI